MWAYRLFGLTVESAIQLNGAAPSAEPPDVVVIFGKSPDVLMGLASSGIGWSVVQDQALFDFSGVARYWIQQGRTITITPVKGADTESIRLGLVEGAMIALLYQRGSFVLHAATVWYQGRLVALAGHSATGKSTLAMELVRRGGRLLSDDLTVVSLGDKGGALRVHPGLASIRLWRDALDHFQLPASVVHRSRPGLEKYCVAVPECRIDGDLGLSAVVILRPPNQTLPWTRLEGRRAFSGIYGQTRALRIAQAIQGSGHFRLTAALARLPLFTLARPAGGLRSLPDLADTVSHGVLI